MKQTEKIARHLETYGSITSLEAMQDYGIMRLASRVSELKKDGHNITGHMITVKNRFGENCSVKQYRMGGGAGG